MKNLLFALLMICSGITYAQENKGTFEIHGEIEGVDHDKIQLIIPGRRPFKAKVKEGRFYITGEIDHTASVNFRYKELISSSFYLDNSTIRLKLRLLRFEESGQKQLGFTKETYTPIYGIVEMQGNEVQNAYNEYLGFKRKNKEKPNFDGLLFDYLKDKIDNQPGNYLYFDILNNLAFENKYLTPNQILKLAEGLDLSYIDLETKKRFVEIIQQNRR